MPQSDMPDPIENSIAPRNWWRLGFWGAMLLYAALFLYYSQTDAFSWDEAYHLLTAQLILLGKQPYLDFCFPQTPLNAYWNAFWMSLLGQSWRVSHALAALLTMSSVLLTADFVARQFPVPGWRIACALTAALAFGLNTMVVQFGPLSQPYAICLFTLVLAFRLSMLAVGRAEILFAASVGLLAGTAAASSLLSAAAAPVLLLWIVVYNRVGSRWLKFVAFSVGAAIPFNPVILLALEGPREVWFNVIQYHSTFRKLYWPDTTRHDLEILTSWIDSGPALLLGLLALFGLLYIARRSEWPPSLKAEFYLCAWLAVGVASELGFAHPTFSQYFLLIVPFLAILAAVGMYAVASRVLDADRPLRPVLLVTGLFAFGLAQSLYDHREDNTWHMYEQLAAKIDQVTPKDAPVFATEHIYFLTKRLPPSGYELDYSHKVDLPPDDRARLHLVTEAEVKQQVQAGIFATAYVCDTDRIEQYGLTKLYNQRVDMLTCSIF